MKLTTIKDVLGNTYIGLHLMQDNIDMFLKFAHDNIVNFKFLNDNLLKRNNGNYHVTAFNVAECQKNPLIIYLKDIDINDLKMIGIGSISKNDNTTFFIVCQSVTINKMRLSLGLDFRDLHITIGFTKKDLFHMGKSNCNILFFKNL